MIQANLLGDLHFFTCVVETGSFSAAAERIGVAKSSLSRRIKHLEQALGVQLLNRTSRQVAVTTIGEQIYRHALDMIAAAEAAAHSAQEAVGKPGGVIRIAAPGVLLDWLMPQLHGFRQRYPDVTYALNQQDAQLDLRTQRLDVSLSLDEVPTDSSEIVARPLARLRNAIVGTPALLQQLGNPRSAQHLPDSALLAVGRQTPRPWQLEVLPRSLHQPAMLADDLLAARNAATAGLGLACLPVYVCRNELTSGALVVACHDDRPLPTTLYALTSPHRAVTHTTRCFLMELRAALESATPYGVEPIQAEPAPATA